MKRVIDILGATIGLILAAPLFVIVGIFIKIDSPGPVFFMQERIGLNRRRRERRIIEVKLTEEERKIERRKKNLYGKSFYLYKFRTMVIDAEKGCGPIWAKKDDPRITYIGRILRKTRIDELPQLLNVLKGDMSLVGPRPERYYFVKDFMQKIDGYPHRLKVKPGITGLAQGTAEYESSVNDVKILRMKYLKPQYNVKLKLQYNLFYAKNWSISKDLPPRS